jgi:hypothetical protein
VGGCLQRFCKPKVKLIVILATVSYQKFPLAGVGR